MRITDLASNVVVTRERKLPNGTSEKEYEVRPSANGAMKGAVAGATIGSVVPVVGTAVGGLVGGVVGLIFGPED